MLLVARAAGRPVLLLPVGGAAAAAAAAAVRYEALQLAQPAAALARKDWITFSLTPPGRQAGSHRASPKACGYQ